MRHDHTHKARSLAEAERLQRRYVDGDLPRRFRRTFERKVHPVRHERARVPLINTVPDDVLIKLMAVRYEASKRH